MTIIDAQVHVWPPETAERPYYQRRCIQTHRPVAFEYPDLLGEMTAAGVDRAILVPPSWEGYRNDYALEAAQKYPNRFAVMAKCRSMIARARQRWRPG